MKKLLVLIVISAGIFLYQEQLKVIAENLIDRVKIEISSQENNFGKTGINKHESGDNNKQEGGYSSITLGDSADSLLSKMGQPSKIEGSEYDFKWYVYNDDYDKFCMIGVQDDEVVALFSNTMNSSESGDIKLGDTKSQVLENYDTLDYRQVGYTRYMISEDYYNLIKGNSSYITVFYDSFEDDEVVGIQIVSEKVENKISGIYTEDTSVVDDFENINRYMINSERVKQGLNTLSYSEKATLCARSHSQDMRDNDYFAHENLKNQSPFDRMDDYDIYYTSAAENIAAGQTSTIFAHHALMNSEGHRVNILGKYKYIGVGVAFGGSMNMYLTQNFYKII